MFPVCTASIKRGRTMDYAIPVVATAALVVSAAAALALIAVAALFAEALALRPNDPVVALIHAAMKLQRLVREAARGAVGLIRSR